MADLVQGVVEVVAEKLFQNKEPCVSLVGTSSKAITAISNAVSKQALPVGAESVSALMERSMAEITNAVSQRASEITGGAISAQTIEVGMKAASSVIKEKISEVVSEAAAAQPPPNAEEEYIGEAAAPEQD